MSATPQPKPKKQKRPPKSDSLSRIIDDKPSADAALPLQIKFLERCWSWWSANTHERFLLAWHAGEILSARRKQCDHGNSDKIRKGDGETFPDWIADNAPMIRIRTAYRWADIFNYVKPDDPNIDFDALTLKTALQIAGDYKRAESVKRHRRKRGNSEHNKRPEHTPGTYVNQVLNASIKFKERIDSYHARDFKENAVREVQAFRAWCSSALQAITMLVDGFHSLSDLGTDILGEQSADIAQKVKDIAGLRDMLTTISAVPLSANKTKPRKPKRKASAKTTTRKTASKKRRAA